MILSLKNKNSIKIFIVATLLAAITFVASQYFTGKTNEVVVAKINDQEIYKSEIEKKLRDVFEGQSFKSQEQEIKVPTLETLPKEVIEILAKEVYLEKELIKAAKNSAVAKSPEVKAKIAEAEAKILRQSYVDSIVKNEVSDQKISEKYAELSKEFEGKKEYLIAHIVSASSQDAEKIANELKSKKAPKFSDLAKKYSIDQESASKGGELGYNLESNLIKEIADVIPNLKQDEISAPIQTKFGWHLVKILGSRDAQAMPFESVKDNIREHLTQEAVNDINGKITKDVKVEILIQLKKEEPKIETPKTEEKKPEELSGEEQVSDEAKPAQATEEEAANKPQNAEGDVVEENLDEKTEEKKAAEVKKEKPKKAEKKSKKSNEKSKAKKQKNKNQR